MRVLIADKFPAPGREVLARSGEVVYKPELGEADLPAALLDSGADILVVRSTVVNAAAMQAPNLSLVIRAGAGVNTIDLKAASSRGIFVANCPGKNAIAVAELTFALLLALDRRIVDATADLRAGKWEKAKYSVADGLYGKRLGIAGLGAIGRDLLERARGFGLEAHAWSRSLTPNKAAKLGVGYARTLEELAGMCDILSVHLPLTPQTRGVISRNVLSALPDGAVLVNTARAEVLDYVALEELIVKKSLRVGLDVFPDEPDKATAPFTSALLEKGLVYATPHIGASTEQAQRAIAAETARIIRAFLTEEDVPNVVNICATSPARYAVVLRMLDKVGVLANTLSVLKRHGINIEEISNTVFDGAKATCTKLRVSGRPSDAALKEVAAFEETLHVDVVPMPNRA
jgi:D-3-phosphoglycerate dehydrogenase